MSKKFISISYCLFVFFLVFLETSCLSKSNTGQFTLINDSDELISHATVEVCDQLIEVKNIKPHEEFNGSFKVTGDSHYKMTVSFSSGKEIKDELGYVTHGFNYRHTIIVTDSKISISDTKIE
jgi:hypothetical protein